jgi:4-amino-4-deoxy-L-arabinose transferase-like glycosyltransferase
MQKVIIISVIFLLYIPLALSSTPVSSETLVSAVALVILLVAGLGLTRFTGPDERDQPFETRLFVSAFALRAAAVIVIYQFGLVKVLGDDDASLWFIGDWLADRWRQMSVTGIFSDAFTFLHQQHGSLATTQRGYYVLLGGFFYLLSGASRIAAGFLNAWFGAMTVVLTYRLAVILFGRKAAKYTGIAACIMPSLIIWSAQTLKEPVVIFLEVLALYATLRMQHRLSVRYIIVVCASVVALVTMRFYAAYIVAGAVVLGLVSAKGFKPRLAALIASLLLVPLLSLSGFLQRDSKQIKSFDIDYVVNIRSELAKGPGSNSAVVSSYNLRSPSGFALAISTGAANLLAAPFPWQLGRASLRMLLTLPEVITWWWLLVFAFIPGLRKTIKDYPRGITAVFIFCLALGLLYAAIFANVGIVFRQRAQLMPFLLLFIGVGLNMRAEKRRMRNAPLGEQAVEPIPQMTQLTRHASSHT